MSAGRPVLAALAAGACAAAAYRARTALSDRRQAPWRRTNHAGTQVTLLEGPAYVVGAAAGAALAGPGPALATVAAGAFGALDDLAGDSSSKGLRGHVGALASGRVTTGAVKILGLVASGLLAAALADRRADRRTASPEDRRHARPGAVGTLVGGAVVAGSANLANLLDLRPGRALKATTIAGGAILARPGRPGAAAAAAAVGAAVALLLPDLREESMLGDTGANAAGALVGSALVQRTGTRGRLVALAVLIGATLASEKVSFTQVIESTPGLRDLDALGRPPR